MQPLDISLLISFFGLHDLKVKGRTRIQKELCILKYRHNIPINFDFEPYYYGPYSPELTDAVDTLVATGLLEQSIVRLGSGLQRYDYTLTEQGKRLFYTIKQKLEREQPDLIQVMEENVKVLEEMDISSVVSLAKQFSGITSIA